MIQAVLFDLDGTLTNTIDDIATAMNRESDPAKTMQRQAKRAQEAQNANTADTQAPPQK